MKIFCEHRRTHYKNDRKRGYAKKVCNRCHKVLKHIGGSGRDVRFSKKEEKIRF